MEREVEAVDETEAATLERLGRRAALGSFLVPPLGIVFGWALLRRLKGRRIGNARVLAIGAMLNGVVSTVIIVKFVYWAPRLIRWLQGIAEGL